MPAIDRPLSDCRYDRSQGSVGNGVAFFTATDGECEAAAETDDYERPSVDLSMPPQIYQSGGNAGTG